MATINETAKRFRITDVGRTIVGIATEFGVRGRNGVLWQPEQFEDWIALETTLPLRVDHGPVVDSRGVIMNVGTVRFFAEIRYPSHAILCLAEVDHAEGYGDALLADIRSILSQTWLPRAWGLSLAAHYTAEFAVPYECSVTRFPAFQDCKILGVGVDAIESWALLTEV